MVMKIDKTKEIRQQPNQLKKIMGCRTALKNKIIMIISLWRKITQIIMIIGHKKITQIIMIIDHNRKINRIIKKNIGINKSGKYAGLFPCY